MMRRTATRAFWHDACLVRSRANTGMENFYGTPTQFLMPAPGNHVFGFEHDGVSSGYGQGFNETKFNFLTRFRWNTTPLGACPLYLRHPSRHKYVHWMYVSRMGKFWQEHGELEPWNMLLIGWIIIIYTVWHCYRYMLYHPHHSTYALTSMPTKNSIQMRRHEQYHPMDKPVFRYYQSVPEVWSNSPMRDIYAMGILANDPYQAACEANGQKDNLVAPFGEKKFTPATGPVAAVQNGEGWYPKYEQWKNVGKHH